MYANYANKSLSVFRCSGQKHCRYNFTTDRSSTRILTKAFHIRKKSSHKNPLGQKEKFSGTFLYRKEKFSQKPCISEKIPTTPFMSKRKILTKSLHFRKKSSHKNLPYQKEESSYKSSNRNRKILTKNFYIKTKNSYKKPVLSGRKILVKIFQIKKKKFPQKPSMSRRKIRIKNLPTQKQKSSNWETEILAEICSKKRTFS